jgi:iron complex outermembrane receptor protein
MTIRTKRTRETIAVSIAALTALAGSVVGSTPGFAADTATNAVGASDELGEVIVTAERRKEDEQKVPVSMTVFNAAAIQAQGLQTTEDIMHYLPNVTLAATSFFGRSQGVFQMRGLPNVTVYIDGIPQQETFGYFGDIVELDRVEVLRGPQGTLFGKNSMGGAIQYITKDPADEFGARVSATYGNFDRFDVTASVDLPLADTLLTKVTVAHLQSNGYLPSQETNLQYGSQDDLVARYVVLWKPTDNFQWRATVSYVDMQNNGNPSLLNSIATGPGSLGGIYDAIGLTIPSNCNYGETHQFKTCSAYQGPDLYDRTTAATTQLDYKINDNLSVKGIGGWRGVADQDFADFSSVPYHLFEGDNYNNIQESTEELQLIYSNDFLTGVVGFFSYHDDREFRRENWFDNEWNSPLVNPTLNAQVVALLGGHQPASIGLPQNVDQLTYTLTHGTAEYTDWTWRATDKLSVIAGVRFNKDDSNTANYNPLLPIPLLCCEASPGTASKGPPTSVVPATATNTSPRVSLQYQWTQDIMTYATYAEGFNQGGGTATASGVIPYAPEQVRNYEVGLRSDLFDRTLRLNLSVFYDRFLDIQVNQDIDFFSVTTNAGLGMSKGAEAEGLWLIGKGLSLQYGFGYLKTAYEDVPAGSGYASGSPFPYAPKWQNNAALQYETPLPNSGKLTLRTDYSYQTGMLSGTGSAGVYIPSYGLLGARATYQEPSQRWEVALYGKNLTDKFYEINGYNIAGLLQQADPGRPREFGITFNFNLH